MFYLILRKFVVGFWKRKQNREVKPPDDKINNFTSKEILVKFPLKSALISRCLVTIKIWRNARVRGIKISSNGMVGMLSHGSKPRLFGFEELERLLITTNH